MSGDPADGFEHVQSPGHGGRSLWRNSQRGAGCAEALRLAPETANPELAALVRHRACTALVALGEYGPPSRRATKNREITASRSGGKAAQTPATAIPCACRTGTDSGAP